MQERPNPTAAQFGDKQEVADVLPGWVQESYASDVLQAPAKVNGSMQHPRGIDVLQAHKI